MRTAAALATIAMLAAAAPTGAAARDHHRVKHGMHRAREVRVVHPPAAIIDVPDPGYRYGGPLYSTCDRINADRMLVGTCR